MAHDAEPHMQYTTRDLERNLIIRYAAFTQELVEHVEYHETYAVTRRKDRGPEWIHYPKELYS